MLRSDHTGSPGVIHNLQALRGLAALLVVFVHLDEFLLPQIGVPFFGGAGVDIFFVISGFIMVVTTANRDVTPITFMADRITRIVPIYWVMTFAVFGLAFVLPTLLESTRVNWTELLKSLTFIPFLKSNGLIAPVLYVGWTLNYEMFFYLLFALGLALPSKKVGAIGLICCLACMVGVGLLEHPQNIFGKFYTNPTVLDFALGMAIGLTHRKIPLNATLSNKIVAAASVFAGITAAILLPLVFVELSSLVVGGLPSCLIVAAAVALERWGWVVRTRWCLVIGNASYSIYVTQPFVTDLVQKVAAKMRLEAVGCLLLVVPLLVGVCLVGILVHRILEQPLSTAARRLLKVRRLNPQMGQSETVHPASATT
jgi:exopolysaccharide production protein ExoZ